MLCESLAARVPLVIGWLRPVILLPASAASGLTVAQLELILAHELAHVRRNDHLINLLQHLIETLLFYHPAVWWVSAKIREERENCCDDLAVQAFDGDKVGYARALARLDDHNIYRLAPAATGGSLLKRVQRLAGKAVQGPPEPNQWMVGAALIVLPLLAIALATSEKVSQELLGTYRSGPISVAELVGEGFSPSVACENSGPWLLIFSERGFFSGNVDADPGCTYQSPFVTGSWSVVGDRVTFRDAKDVGCGLEDYSYVYKLEGDTLSLTPVSDPCPVREYVLTWHTWTRR